MLLGVGLIVFIHMQIWNRTRWAQSRRLETSCTGRPRPCWTSPCPSGQIACKCGCRRIRLLVKSSWRTPCQRARWSWAQTLEPLKNCYNQPLTFIPLWRLVEEEHYVLRVIDLKLLLDRVFILQESKLSHLRREVATGAAALVSRR